MTTVQPTLDAGITLAGTVEKYLTDIEDDVRRITSSDAFRQPCRQRLLRPADGIFRVVHRVVDLQRGEYDGLRAGGDRQNVAAYGEDRNGDGKVVVTLNVYTLDYSDAETQTESAAYLTMAGTTKLATDVQGGLSSVFLLWDPAGFEESTGSLRYLDGTLPAADSDEDWWNMVYKWDDCPVLAGLDLGDYGPDTTQSRSGSSQEYMSQFYVGMRGAWNSGTADNLAGSEEFWQKLTEGAVSTAAPEG